MSYLDADPRRGRPACHLSIVAGSHPRTSPIIASGSGSRYLPSVSGLTPMRSASSRRDRYVFIIPPSREAGAPASLGSRSAALCGPPRGVAQLAALRAHGRPVAGRDVFRGMQGRELLGGLRCEAQAQLAARAGEVGVGGGEDEYAGHVTHPLRGCDPRLAGGSARPVLRTIHVHRVYATTSKVKDRRATA